jgi:hypothetical protein
MDVEQGCEEEFVLVNNEVTIFIQNLN